MAFERQKKFDMLFVDWGELGEDHAPETNIVVEVGNGVQGVLDGIVEKEGKPRYILTDAFMCDKTGKSLEKYDKNLYVKGNTSLNKQMLEDDADDFIPVKEGDNVRIVFLGKYTTKLGGVGYGMDVYVNRGK